MSWQELADARPELAAFGQARLAGKPAYLATLRGDGSPRLHPVTPIVGDGRLFLFMEPTSPKGHDLQRDGRYALHAAVADAQGGEGEFSLAGRAQLVEGSELRALATRLSSYSPAARYILFELSVERAASTVYAGGVARREQWLREGLTRQFG